VRGLGSVLQIKVRHRVALIRREIKRLAAIAAERTTQAESMLVSDRFRPLSEAETTAIWAANCWEDPRAFLAHKIRYFHESACTQLSRAAVAGVKARAYACAQRTGEGRGKRREEDRGIASEVAAGEVARLKLGYKAGTRADSASPGS
jgi:hypothetical protein